MKVRVNGIYKFEANGWDRFDPKHRGLLKDGDLVQVINLPGAPPANTMGQCYVRLVGDSSTAFAMVSTGSLSANPTNARRRARHQAMTDLGLKRVKGALGGTYYE